MLELCQLSAGYPGRTVLQELSLSFPAGQVTVLLGPNGCGKSTLLKTLCGILPAQGGRVLMDGEDWLSLPGKMLARKVAYLSQERRIPDITVGRMVLHGRFPHLGYPRRYRAEDYAAAQKAMEQMELMELAEEPLQKLSGGQRQKVYIAMALAQSTPVIALDEPTTYLDVRHQLQMMAQAKMLAADGKTVIMVLHDLSLAMSVAQQIVLLSDGTAAQGSPEEVFASGQIDAAFGVKLRRMETEEGWRYYYGGEAK